MRLVLLIHFFAYFCFAKEDVFTKSTVVKDCSYDGVECLEGVNRFSKNLSTAYLPPQVEDIYILDEQVLHKNGNAEHKNSFTQLDRFLERKERLDFKTMPFSQRNKFLTLLTKIFGNVCTEAACVVVDEIPDIQFPKMSRARAVYGLQGQDAVGGPVLFIFASDKNKRILIYSSIESSEKKLCTSQRRNCDRCQAKDKNLADVLSCQKSQEIQEKVRKRALELIQTFKKNKF